MAQSRPEAFDTLPDSSSSSFKAVSLSLTQFTQYLHSLCVCVGTKEEQYKYLYSTLKEIKEENSSIYSNKFKSNFNFVPRRERKRERPGSSVYEWCVCGVC